MESATQGAARHVAPPRISVVVPVFNGERFLGEALRSVQSQEGVEIEVIVIDDGSTDRSFAIAEEFAQDDPRIRILRQPNAGLAEARNTGIRAARAEYIALLDHDDLFLPGKLVEQATFLDGNPDVAAVGTHGWRIGERGNVLGVFDVGPTSHAHFEEIRRDDELIYLLAASVMFRREVALELGGFRHEPYGGEDVDLWTRMADTNVILTIPRRLVHYRVHSRSMSTTKLFGLLHTTERLRINVVRRRRGATEFSHEQFLAALAEKPRLERLRRSLHQRSRYAYRVAGGLLANRNLLGLAWLAASFLLYPSVPIVRLQAQLVPALKRSTHEGQ